jgi:hypothetical protein
MLHTAYGKCESIEGNNIMNMAKVQHKYCSTLQKNVKTNPNIQVETKNKKMARVHPFYKSDSYHKQCMNR